LVRIHPPKFTFRPNDQPRRRLEPDLAVAATVLVWVPAVLVLDRTVGLAGQRLLGLLTWGLLVALLRRESMLTRVQVGVVVAFATAVEYTFSPLLEVYVYRLHNVPAFVPPGHGLVYLCALCLGRSALVRRYGRALVVATVAIGGAWAGYGLVLADRPDALGAFWFACLVGFLFLGPSRLLYVGAFVVVSYLELLGTWLGTWAWQPRDPTGLVSIGNPPSGAAGGYGWFDLAALLAAPALLAMFQRLRERTPKEVFDSQQALGADSPTCLRELSITRRSSRFAPSPIRCVCASCRS
jgi:hypothetical protein